MGTTTSGSPPPDTGGFRVTQAGDRLVAAWRPPLSERVGVVFLTIAAWLGMPLSLLIDGKRPIISPATGQVDWILIGILVFLGAGLGVPMLLGTLPQAWQMARAEIEQVPHKTRNKTRIVNFVCYGHDAAPGEHLSPQSPYKQGGDGELCRSPAIHSSHRA